MFTLSKCSTIKFLRGAPLFQSVSSVYSTKAEKSTKSRSSSTLPYKNVLTAAEIKRLLRLVYARVHPDLFTNHLQAQKENENSLKILRNMFEIFDSSANNSPSLTRSSSSSAQNDLIFYVKQLSADEPSELKKILIKNASNSDSSSQASIKSILNQLIDELEIPASKFHAPFNNESSSRNPIGQKGFNYTVTYRDGNNLDFDEDYVNYADLERWNNEHKAQNRVPKLEEWLEENKSKIELKQDESKLIKKQIAENKDRLIEKWKLKNIIFKSNWSLKHFNAYLLALNNFTLNNHDTHFEGFTLVIANNLSSGLRKNGHIYLNCAQVYEEWLNVLAVSKKNVQLLDEIKLMENNLSNILRQIKICDPFPLETMDDDQENEYNIVQSAAYHHFCLNNILNNITCDFRSPDDFECSLERNDFSNLQLIIQNTNFIKLNKIGQFMIGTSSNIKYTNVVDFIEKNKVKSVDLYKEYSKVIESLRKSQSSLQTRLNSAILFDGRVEAEQKLGALNKLSSLLDRNSDLFSILQNNNLKIGTVYSVNENGSIQIPWNFA